MMQSSVSFGGGQLFQIVASEDTVLLCGPKHTDLTDPVVHAESLFPAERIENDRVLRQRLEQRRKMASCLFSGYGDKARKPVLREPCQSVSGAGDGPKIFHRIQPADMGEFQIGCRIKRSALDQPLIQDPRIEQAFIRCLFDAEMPEHHSQSTHEATRFPKVPKLRIRKPLCRPCLRLVEAGIRLQPCQVCSILLPLLRIYTSGSASAGRFRYRDRWLRSSTLS